jgi:hypothetical protein
VEGILRRQYLLGAVVVMLAAGAIGETGIAQQPSRDGGQSCDPLIDGTYCATQGGRTFSGGGSSSVNMGSIQSLSGDLSLGQNSPATFAGVSFSGGTTCMGLLRRAGCN